MKEMSSVRPCHRGGWIRRSSGYYLRIEDRGVRIEHPGIGMEDEQGSCGENRKPES
jgi:hypothetical protein